MRRITEEHPPECLMMGMGWKAGDTAPLSCTIPQWQGFNLISRMIFTGFQRREQGLANIVLT